MRHLLDLDDDYPIATPSTRVPVFMIAGIISACIIIGIIVVITIVCCVCRRQGYSRGRVLRPNTSTTTYQTTTTYALPGQAPMANYSMGQTGYPPAQGYPLGQQAYPPAQQGYPYGQPGYPQQGYPPASGMAPPPYNAVVSSTVSYPPASASGPAVVDSKQMSAPPAAKPSAPPME